MTDPHDTFSIFAEVSVALAGFSGIVIAFGRRSISELTPLQSRRLSNLFILSGLSLFISLLGVSLLHMESLDLRDLWRMGSASLFLLATPWLIWDIVRVYRLDKAERAQANLLVFSVFYSSVLAMLGLQLANSIVIADAWPLFLALVLTIVGAFQQFVLLVRTQQIENRQDSESDPR